MTVETAGLVVTGVAIRVDKAVVVAGVAMDVTEVEPRPASEVLEAEPAGLVMVEVEVDNAVDGVVVNGVEMDEEEEAVEVVS